MKEYINTHKGIMTRNLVLIFDLIFVMDHQMELCSFFLSSFSFFFFLSKTTRHSNVTDSGYRAEIIDTECTARTSFYRGRTTKNHRVP